MKCLSNLKSFSVFGFAMEVYLFMDTTPQYVQLPLGAGAPFSVMVEPLESYYIRMDWPQNQRNLPLRNNK